MMIYNIKRLSHGVFISIVVALMISSSLITAQTKKETSRWNKCLKKVRKIREDVGKLEVYEQFLKKYPNNFYVPEAKKSITKIELQFIAPEDFTAAVKENTFESYSKFIGKHNDGKLVRTAKLLAMIK